MAIEGIDRAEGAVKLQVQSQFGVIMRAEKQRIGLAAMTMAVDGTPVDIGDARKAWHFAAPRPDQQNTPTDDPFAALVRLTSESAPEDPLYIENNAEHIRVLDDGTFDPPDPGPSKDPRPGRKGQVLVKGGYSVQAPQGITGVVVDQVASQFGLQRVTSVT